MNLSRRLLVAWIVLLPWVSKLANANTNDIQIAPCKFPFDASKAGNTLNVNFELKKSASWYIDLETEYTAETQYEVTFFSTSRLSKKVFEIPVKIKLFTISGKLVLDKLIITGDSYAHGFYPKNSGYFIREIILEKLEAGKYTLEIETLNNEPDIFAKSFISIKQFYKK